ncbi:MAG: flagellar biosynthesis/type III secretory pathway protein FliH [Neolewinella sp.]|jgi:flagellar biosynthesis/type III secretory pathway protein FliH
MRQTPDTAALLLSWRALYRRLLATPGGRSIAFLLVSYTAAVSNDEPERLRLAFRQIEPAMESDYMTTAEQLIQRGREQGLQEGAAQGVAQGVAQGAAQVLLAQLEQRFGPLGEATVQHVRGASAKQLEQIARVILTAATLDEVLPG